MSDERGPFDGRPFYCKGCGAGFGEFLACELPTAAGCELESERRAQERRARHVRRRSRVKPTDRRTTTRGNGSTRRKRSRC